jgi:hypothetical protein
LERLADIIVSGTIVVPPITRIKLEDVPALNGNPPPTEKRSSPP